MPSPADPRARRPADPRRPTATRVHFRPFGVHFRPFGVHPCTFSVRPGFRAHGSLVLR